MAALPVLDQLRSLSARWAMIFETLVIALAGVLGIADAFAQASLYGLTSAAFPPVMTQALMCGVAICGTLVTLARMACKVLTDDLFVSTYIFFAFSAVYAFGSAALYCTARVRNPLFRSRLKAAIETSPTLALRHYEVRVRPTLPCCVWSWALALPVLTSRGHQGVHSRHALRSFTLRGAPSDAEATAALSPGKVQSVLTAVNSVCPLWACVAQSHLLPQFYVMWKYYVLNSTITRQRLVLSRPVVLAKI